MLPLIAVLVIAIGFSAFFTAAEAALFSVGESRVRALVEEGRRGSRALQRLRAQPERTLILLRLGDVVADVAAAVLAGYLAFALEGPAIALVVAVVALLILLGGELVPIRFAVHRGARLALALSPSLLILSRILAPLLLVLQRLARVLPEPSPVTVPGLPEAELRELTALAHGEVGVIEEHERQLIERAFRLDEWRAWDVMTPRVDVFAWQDSLTLAAIAPQLATVPYSRVPVYGASVDDITGVLYLRDAYQALVTGQRDVALRALAREPLIVPGSVSLTKLLRDFQTRRIHLAIVVDEYGGTDGLVTLEDVLEELVGEIVDETDVPEEEPIVRVSRQELLAAGDADLREINHFFNTSLPQLEHRSLNGYLLDELGRVPEAGERLERDGVRIEVLEATETQVLRARVQRTGTAPEKPPGEQGDRPAGETAAADTNADAVQPSTAREAHATPGGSAAGESAAARQPAPGDGAHGQRVAHHEATPRSPGAAGAPPGE